jgi:class 3 adenylate cyclase
LTAWPAAAQYRVAAMRRRLAAILSADVAGYPRSMAHDEAATVETLITPRAVVTGLVTEHHGRVVDSPGDNVLVEFPSVVDFTRATWARLAGVDQEMNHRDLDDLERLGLG